MLLSLALSFFLFAELGPEVGATIPQTERFEEALGEEGATIVFVRSVDWCPFCKTQVMELSEAAASFEAEDRPLIFVSYDSSELQQTFAARNEIEQTFIADEGSEIIKAFGILNENHRPGSRAYGIPHPSVFIVNEDGVVEDKLYEEDYITNSRSYRNRPAVDVILEAVREAD